MHRTGIEDYYVTKNNKRLRYGYTTGTCAAAASKAAAIAVATGHIPSTVEIDTPKGIRLNLEVQCRLLDKDRSECTVIKDSGDDPDVTNGMPVCSTVSLRPDGKVTLDGGEGVGRVTRPGLEQAIGEAAINRVPRQMILRELQTVRDDFDIKEGFHAEIVLPMGRQLAARTFNPRLGIEGGLSVLGTSGIVEPMSEAAIIESIKVELKQKRSQGREFVIITPGNYGAEFVKGMAGFDDEDVVKCSNYLGATIDIISDLGFKEVLFISHIGKFIKVAGGIMNTHSREADSRMEILAANSALAGMEREGVAKIMSCINTDDGLEVLKSYGLLEKTMEIIGRKIDFYINNRSYGKFKTGVIVFSNRHGLLYRSGDIVKERMNG